MHVGPGGRTRKGALVWIGLLGAGRIGKMRAQVPKGIDALDGLLITDPDAYAAQELAAGVGARAVTLERLQHRIVRVDEIPA